MIAMGSGVKLLGGGGERLKLTKLGLEFEAKMLIL